MTDATASEQPRHAPTLLAVDAAGMLCIGGVPASLLAERHGTPLYAIDAALVRTRVAEVRAILPAGMRLHYAVKANPLPELLSLLAKLVDGFDIASLGELQAAVAAGKTGRDLGFAGPAKRDVELQAALDCGAVVNVESAGELARLSALAATGAQRGHAAIRVNPDFELRHSGMRMGGGAQAFGIDAEHVPSILKSWPDTIDFEGFHVYAGSQNLSGTQIAAALHKTYELCRDLAHHAPCPPALINLGGGFGIPYFAGDTRLDLAPIRTALHDIAESARQHLPGTTVLLELGRYLVGEAGVFLTRVIDRKTSRGETFLLCDGGMHNHLAASGNFGQVLRRDYPVWLARDPHAPAIETVNVCGPLCTPLDVLGRQVALPRAEVGDLIAIGQSGAYGASASPSAFLSHPQAGQVLV